MTGEVEEKKENKKRGFLRRHIMDAQKEAVKESMFPREARAGIETIKELIRKIGPWRYRPSEFSTWANPKKTDISFRQAMRKAGVSEEDLVPKHKIFAISTYACVLAAGLSAALGIGRTIGGEAYFGVAIGGSGLVLSLSLFFKYSLAAMQIRKRDLNIGWREWLAHKWEWIPPYEIKVRRIVRRKIAEEVDNTERPPTDE